MMPVAGGVMAFSYKAFNSTFAIIGAWGSLGGMIAIIPWEAIQITDVLSYLIPGIKSGDPLYQVMGSDIYLITIILGVVFSFLLFALNMRGLASAAFVQKILCFVLVGCAVLGAIVSLIYGDTDNLKPIYDVSNPQIYGEAEGLKQVAHTGLMGGMFAIVAQAAFFLAGFETIPQGIEEAGGDIDSVGKTVVLSVALACIFYAILLFAFGCGWPWQEFALMERPAASTMFLSLLAGTGGKILYWIITIGALAGLFTTWNGFFTASANILMGMARGRLIPRFYAKQNKNGIAVNGQITVLVLSCIGPFLGPNLIDSITCFSASAFMLSWSLTTWSLVVLRKKYPNWNRPYRIPGGIVMGLFAAFCVSASFVLMFVPASPFYVGGLSVKMFCIWMAIGLLLYIASAGQRKGLSREELEEGVFGGIKLETGERA